MFITIEGLDGVGKTTQACLLADYLKSLHGENNVILTREPGGTKLNEQIRQLIIQSRDEKIDPLAELLFFIAMRREHFIKVIKPALKINKIVVCDRFIDSTLAYQGYGYGLSIKLIKKLHNLSVDLMPDLTLIIDVDLEQSLKRAKQSKYETLGKDFYNKVKDGFQHIAKEYPKRCYVINENGFINNLDSSDSKVISNIDHMHTKIINLIRQKLMN